ncbi:hypothetical protein [Actinoplanes derwentensis]|nr:hypothetical protein [Actinoplanes derwentensis]
MDITIPAPYDARRFAENIAERRGRRIQVIELDTSLAAAPCGLWLATANRDLVVVDSNAPGYVQDHILTHELSHILCNHRGNLEIDADTLPLLSLDPAMVQRVLGRTRRYPTPAEHEAEVLASVIVDTARSRYNVPRPLGRADAPDAVLDRCSATFGGDRGWL